jgi:type I restriction enzyme S subunit
MAVEWPLKTIAECAHPEAYSTQIGPFGKALMANQYTDAGVPVLRGVNVNRGRFHDDDFVFVDDVTADRLSKFESFPGDVLLVHKGTLGQIGLMPKRPKYHRYIMGNSMMRVRCDPAKLLPEYLYYWLTSADGQHYLFSRVSQVGVPQIQTPLTTLRQARLPVPGISEQRSIIHILGTLDEKIELNQRMNDTLEAMTRGLFKSWFVDFEPVRAKAEGRNHGLPKSVAEFFPARFVDSELGEIPAGWEVSSIGLVAYVIDCLHSKKPERLAFGMPLLQLANIRGDGLIDMHDSYFIDEDNYRKWVSRMEASPADCVITNVGRVGAAAQMPAGQKAALGRNMTGVRCKPEFPFPTMLIECLLSQAMKDEIVLKMDTGTILDALNVRNIPRLRFVRPRTREILDYFENKVRPLRAQMEAHLAESRILAALRDTLLPKLMSGELRVKEAAKKVGDVL